MRSGARPQSNPRPQNHLRQRQEEEVHHRPERRPATPNRNRPVPRGRAESPARPSSGEVCRYFSNGHCKNGSSCKFSHGTSSTRSSTRPPVVSDESDHDDNSSGSSAHAKPPCKYFLEGNCTNKNCQYPHVKRSKGVSLPVAVASAVPIAEVVDMEKIGRELQRTVRFISEEERKALSLDLVIVMDCTGSMSRWIQAAREQVNSIINQVKSNFGQKATIKVGFVGYRDYDVPEKRICPKPLTENIDEVRAFIAEQSATGGDDAPEDIPGGFQAALAMNWTSSAKLLILVTDAPCHGSRYHNLPDGADRLGRSTDPNIERQMREMASRGIGFAMIDIKPNDTKVMVPLLRAAYESEVNVQKANQSGKGKKKVGMSNALTFTVIPFQSGSSSSRDTDRAASELLTMTLVSCCTNSLEASVSQSVESLKRLSRQRDMSSLSSKAAALTIHEETEEEDDSSDEEEEIPPSAQLPKSKLKWDVIEELHPENAMRYTYWLNIKDVPLEVWASDPLNPKYLARNQQSTTVRVMRSSFNEGAMRTAHGLKDEHISQQLVAKVYKKPRDRELKNYQLDAQIQTIAKGLAKEFSKHPQSMAAIDFISVSYYEMVDRPSNDPFKYFAAEPLMSGTYVKYINNGGFVTDKATNDNVSNIAQAFSHFTWEASKARLHVVDLQGVDNILTDPQIHSKKGGGMLGKGDTGHWGSAQFFRTHVCNEYCRALSLHHPVQSSSKVAGKVAIHKGSSTPVPGSSQVQLCCELYCGTVFTSSRESYLEELGKGLEIYCAGCNHAKKEQIGTKKCEKCSTTFQWQAFWYRMKGMEAPKECNKCRAKK